MAAGDVVNTAAEICRVRRRWDGDLVDEATAPASLERAIEYRVQTSPVDGEGQDSRRSSCARGRPAARARFWDRRPAPSACAPLVGRVRELDLLARGVRAGEGRARAPARHAGRRAGHRQEPARLGAGSSTSTARRRPGWRGGRVARCRTPSESPSGRSRRSSKPRRASSRPTASPTPRARLDRVSPRTAGLDDVGEWTGCRATSGHSSACELGRRRVARQSPRGGICCVAALP